jgi:hypothetical protein
MDATRSGPTSGHGGTERSARHARHLDRQLAGTAGDKVPGRTVVETITRIDLALRSGFSQSGHFDRVSADGGFAMSVSTGSSTTRRHDGSRSTT